MIRQFAEQGRAKSAHTERESKEKTGNESHLPRNKFLRIHQDSRECRREYHTNGNDQYPGPEQISVRQQQRERSYSKDRDPDNIFTAEPVSQWASQQSACGNREQKYEKIDLRIL